MWNRREGKGREEEGRGGEGRAAMNAVREESCMSWLILRSTNHSYTYTLFDMLVNFSLFKKQFAMSTSTLHQKICALPYSMNPYQCLKKAQLWSFEHVVFYFFFRFDF